MHIRRPSRPRKDKRGTTEGKTLPVQGEDQHGVPRMPHERDESADSQTAGEPSGRRMGQIAQADMERGLVDTDKGPALDEAYDKTRQGTDQPEKQFTPGGRRR